MWYNTRVNHIKSDKVLIAPCHPFSTDVMGIDTMNDHTRASSFPENLQDYAPWVTTHGLVAPYGECQCGCGARTSIAPQSITVLEHRKGHPLRVCLGHRTGRGLFVAAERSPNIPYGYCHCGCGRITKIADRMNVRLGIRKGEPFLYLKGHSGGTRGRTLEQRFWAMVRKGEGVDACWEWIGSLNNQGYGQFNIDGKLELAHRVSYKLAHGSIGDGMKVLHRCDNPPCVRPSHLFEGTLSDNSKDMVAKSRRIYATGMIYRHKLTEGEVLHLRSLGKLQRGELVSLARRYGVRTATIRNAIDGKTWRNLP